MNGSGSLARTTRLALIGGVAAFGSALPLVDITLSATWLLAAAVAVGVVTLSGFALRALRLPTAMTVTVQLVLLAMWVGALVAAESALFGFLPTVEWGRALVAFAQAGLDQSRTYIAPVPVSPGILLLLVGGTGVVAVLVELVAVTGRRVALAGVPLVACYSVAATVAPDGVSWWWFLAPAAGFLALMVSDSRDRIATWGGHTGAADTSADRLGRSDPLARTGRRVGVVAMAAAVAVPAGVPALTEGFLFGSGPGRGGGGQTIRTDNPIVDLQRNLQRPENVDILRYRTSNDRPQYIRTVTLDVFTGEVWQTSDRAVPESVAQGLPRPQGLELSDVPLVDYRFQVTDNYSSRWLPLPYPAQRIDIAGDWRYHNETLDVVSTEDDVLASSYTVSSLDVTPTVEQLRSAGEPDDDVAPSLQLPDDLPELVTELTAEVTAGATDDFGRAAALQNWFRSDGGFVYDLDTEPGHSSSALVDFLTERRGYCEQFAASMAIMARALGIPSRVAVGFTPGDPVGESTWVVRAHDSHAWPELYFQGVGWVRFEPTPAFRSGRAPEWTFIPTRRDPASDPDLPAQPVPGATSTATGAPIAQDDVAGLGGSPEDGTSPWAWTGLAGAVVLGLALFPAGFARLRRRRRWRGPRYGQANAEAAWTDLQYAMRDSGLGWDPARTPRTTARHITETVPLPRAATRSLHRVVAGVEQAWYAGSVEPHTDLGRHTSTVRRALIDAAPWRRRVAAFWWPAEIRDALRRAAARLGAAVDRLEGIPPAERSVGDRP